MLSKLDIWYLHGPDRTTPYEDTLKAVNELYKEGCNNPIFSCWGHFIDAYVSRLFDRFGISNFSAFVTLCLNLKMLLLTYSKDGRLHKLWQSAGKEVIFNRLSTKASTTRFTGWLCLLFISVNHRSRYRNRTVEPELFPCLKKFGLSFYEFNPRMYSKLLPRHLGLIYLVLVGGGFFTGRYVNADTKADAGSRFDPNGIIGKVLSVSDNFQYILIYGLLLLHASSSKHRW